MVRAMGICRVDPKGGRKPGYAPNFMRPQRSGWLATAHALLLVPAVAPFVPRIHHCASANQMELRWRGFGVAASRSEERRVGKECRCRWSACDCRRKRNERERVSRI